MLIIVFFPQMVWMTTYFVMMKHCLIFVLVYKAIKN